MQKKKQRTATAVLAGVMILAVSGCRRTSDVYTAGLRQEAHMETEQESERPPAAEMLPDLQERTEASSVIYIYVCGAVQSPGVYELPGGTRVYEAIAQAGGFTEEADTQWLNQAEPVFDGQRLYVYTARETQEMESERAAASERSQLDGTQNGGRPYGAGREEAPSDLQGSALTEGLINLNTASREELMTLPGIGAAKADAVLAYREEHGAFQTIEEIQKISGIKSAVFSKIKDKITVT